VACAGDFDLVAVGARGIPPFEDVRLFSLPAQCYGSPSETFMSVLHLGTIMIGAKLWKTLNGSTY
jgi:hypothetical protein